MNNSKMDLVLGIVLLAVAGLAVWFLSGSVGAFTAMGAALIGVVLLVRAAQNGGDGASTSMGHEAEPLHLDNSLDNSKEAGYDWDAHYQREFGKPDEYPNR